MIDFVYVYNVPIGPLDEWTIERVVLRPRWWPLISNTYHVFSNVRVVR